jgi:hypothetical protein
VRITCGSDSYSVTVGLRVGNEEATPWSVIGMTYGLSHSSVGMTSECVSGVGSSVRKRGASFTVTSFSLSCIVDKKLWARSGIKIAW